MSYRKLEEQLMDNLHKLEELYEKWEASESELERYKQYIKKTLFCYRVIEWDLQQQMYKSYEQEWKSSS